MKYIISIFFFASILSVFASEESAVDIAKRVIADKTYAYTHSPPVVSDPVACDVTNYVPAGTIYRHDIVDVYMLSDAVPEKVRIAYASTVLASKLAQVPSSSIMLALGVLDERKKDGYVKDGRILAARLAEIKNSEQGDARRPATATEGKSEGNEKPKPESEGRSQ